MKTRKLFFALLAMLLAQTVLAAETPKFEIVTSNVGKMLVTFEPATPVTFEVTISNEDGLLAYQWESGKPEVSLKKIYDLSGLENGNYTFSVNYGNKSVNTAISLKKGEVKVGPTVFLTDPYFSFRNNMLYITYLNPEQKGVYLNIYKNGVHFTGLYLGKEFDLQKCINFKTAESGTYEIVLTGKSDSHLFSLTK